MASASAPRVRGRFRRGVLTLGAALLVVVSVDAMLGGCAPSAPQPTRAPVTPRTGEPVVPSDVARLAPSAAATSAPSAGGTLEPALSAEAIRAHVAALCAPEMAGRGAGADGERRAADYLVAALERWGLGGLPPTGRRFHEFALPARGATPPEETSTARAAAGSSRNVLAFIPGSDPARRAEIIVLGAHYDHVGLREGAVYPGADDNASGTGVVLEVARTLATRRQELGRSVLVVFFGAEELGMVGSRAFVRDQVVEPRRLGAMVNVDMVGRRLADRTGFGLPMRALGIDASRSVAVLGTKGRPAVRELVRRCGQEADLEVVLPEELPGPLAALVDAMSRGRADSATFEAAGIPSLFFSSGESDDYHQPSDVPERLVGPLLARRAEAILRTVIALSHAPLTPGH